jgi:hypothetical protein
MKKLITLALVSLGVIAFAATPALAGNGNGPAPKATGDFWYANPWTDVPTHITFVAQDLGGGSAKGSMSYQDERGSYQARVIAAQVGDTPGLFLFTAEITSSTGAYAVGASEPRPAGTQVPLEVIDGGQSGVNDQAIYLNPGDHLPYQLGPLTAGNIQVHS